MEVSSNRAGPSQTHKLQIRTLLKVGALFGNPNEQRVPPLTWRPGKQNWVGFTRSPKGPFAKYVLGLRKIHPAASCNN